MFKFLINLFVERVQSPLPLKALSRKDLTVCAIRYTIESVEPNIRYWTDESGNYVSNPTDLQAALLHAAYLTKGRPSEKNLRWHRF